MTDNCEVVNNKVVVDVDKLERNGLANYDLNNIELVRGDTPLSIEEKCLKLCAQYLSGDWAQQTIGTIEVRRITGGLNNQLFYCGIRQPILSDVPQEVVIKLYGDDPPMFGTKQEEIFNHLIVSSLFSQRGIGPRVYAHFEGGQIQKFYKQRPFSIEDRNKPQVVEKVFRTLARIHAMNFPIKKKCHAHLMIDLIEKSYDEQSFNELINDYNCETFKENDLKNEINWIKGVINGLNSPVVFCHSDYRSANLMITEPDEELVVCDYDLSGYNFRGSDFVFMIREWNVKHFFQSLKSIDSLPLRDELKPFLSIYVEECQRIYGQSFSDNENNCVEHILKEAKIFLLFEYLFFASPRGRPDEEALPNPKRIMERRETSFKNYFKIKAIFNEQNIFD